MKYIRMTDTADSDIPVMNQSHLLPEISKFISISDNYAVFTTQEQAHPVNDYVDIRKRIVSEWLPANSYEIKDAPEVSVYHWFTKDAKENRYIEIWIPVVKK